jgi:hypothetical protein
MIDILIGNSRNSSNTNRPAAISYITFYPLWTKWQFTPVPHNVYIKLVNVPHKIQQSSLLSVKKSRYTQQQTNNKGKDRLYITE